MIQHAQINKCDINRMRNKNQMVISAGAMNNECYMGQTAYKLDNTGTQGTGDCANSSSQWYPCSCSKHLCYSL